MASASRRRRSTRSTSGRATASPSSTSRATPTAEKAGVEARSTAFPDTRVFTRSEWIDKEDQEIQQFLLLLYVLLALSVIISLFGMVNTLVLSVFERTRELGMLRAVGMTRRQTRRMVRHESVITALIGAALGLPLGIFLAALVTQALSQYDLQFSIPFGSLIVFAVVAVVAGSWRRSCPRAVRPAQRPERAAVRVALEGVWRNRPHRRGAWGRQRGPTAQRLFRQTLLGAGRRRTPLEHLEVAPVGAHGCEDVQDDRAVGSAVASCGVLAGIRQVPPAPSSRRSSPTRKSIVPRRTIPSCSFSWLCSATTAPGSSSTTLIVIRSP